MGNEISWLAEKLHVEEKLSAQSVAEMNQRRSLTMIVIESTEPLGVMCNFSSAAFWKFDYSIRLPCLSKQTLLESVECSSFEQSYCHV
jgi:hypothetical protein